MCKETSGSSASLPHGVGRHGGVELTCIAPD